jgi:enterochelin esterase family protein
MKRVLTKVAVGLLFCSLPVVSCTAQELAKSASLFSPRLTALQKQIEAGNSAALRDFWQEVAAQGTPLLEPIPGDEKHVLVTFLWRSKEELKNVVVFSWFGHYHGRFEIARNQMGHLPGTDLWYKTYRVRNDARSSYRLSPNDSLVPLEEVKPEDWSRRMAAWQPDPLNPHRQFYPRNEEWRDDTDVTRSVVELTAAPPQPWVRPRPGVPAARVELHRLKSEILGNERRVWVYTPAGYKPDAKPYHLLVLFDGWDYLRWMSTPTTLDNLIARAGLPPMVAVMLDEPSLKDRILDLGCYAPFNAFVAKELIPWVRQHYHVTSNPAETIVAGLSRGGLAAAFAALEHSEIFGNVLSQSGYFSWKSWDENDDLEDAEYAWLIHQYAARPKLPIRLYLGTGRFEAGDELLANRHMRDVLEAKGYIVHYAEFSGGHDWECWQGTLADGLLFLAAETANTKATT